MQEKSSCDSSIATDDSIYDEKHGIKSDEVSEKAHCSGLFAAALKSGWHYLKAQVDARKAPIIKNVIMDLGRNVFPAGTSRTPDLNGIKVVSRPNVISSIGSDDIHIWLSYLRYEVGDDKSYHGRSYGRLSHHRSLLMDIHPLQRDTPRAYYVVPDENGKPTHSFHLGPKGCKFYFVIFPTAASRKSIWRETKYVAVNIMVRGDVKGLMRVKLEGKQASVTVENLGTWFIKSGATGAVASSWSGSG
ncbi:MAG: hypothetical protein M1828_003027 [Chrysothrix sp. TS-e1954]|nr:MAG: hypothetical protein M1828_003027 [Chrysothrix sp. TS-e1954]